MNILITGGAGFVGSSLATQFKKHGGSTRVVAFDNLKRRGSELNLPILKSHGIEFVHGDIRNRTDLDSLTDQFDVFIDASAEPSVLAGLGGSPAYVLETNLTGTLNCLEFARKKAGMFLFLSTSRVYSIDPIKRIKLKEGATRFDVADEQIDAGISPAGIAEGFPIHLSRSFYGASKLASEMVIQEYCAMYGFKALINRCGVIAGPGQFGKVDQGVFTMWVAAHEYGQSLTYKGFGGKGKQVRDLLHPADLYELLRIQIGKPEKFTGEIFNAGGSVEGAVSLQEFTKYCQEATGKTIKIAEDPQTSPVDIPYYVSDIGKVKKTFGWSPKRGPREIVGDIHQWLLKDREKLSALFC